MFVTGSDRNSNHHDRGVRGGDNSSGELDLNNVAEKKDEVTLMVFGNEFFTLIRGCSSSSSSSSSRKAQDTQQLDLDRDREFLPVPKSYCISFSDKKQDERREEEQKMENHEREHERDRKPENDNKTESRKLVLAAIRIRQIPKMFTTTREMESFIIMMLHISSVITAFTIVSAMIIFVCFS